MRSLGKCLKAVHSRENAREPDHQKLVRCELRQEGDVHVWDDAAGLVETATGSCVRRRRPRVVLMDVAREELGVVELVESVLIAVGGNPWGSKGSGARNARIARQKTTMLNWTRPSVQFDSSLRLEKHVACIEFTIVSPLKTR